MREVYTYKGTFKSTSAVASHELIGTIAPLQPNTIQNRELLSYLLGEGGWERRPARRSIAGKLFYPPYNSTIRLVCHRKGAIKGTLTIIKVPLFINPSVFSVPSVVIDICKFLEWQANQVNAEYLIWSDEFTILTEEQVLLSDHPVCQAYWLQAILSKYSSILGVK